MSLTFAEIKKQIVKDFPEIEMMMEDQGSFSNNYIRMKGYGCNCLEMNDTRIGVYLTVPQTYCINLVSRKCMIMHETNLYEAFTKMRFFHKNDLNNYWTYDDLKECVRKMIAFQKKVNNYISLLNYKTLTEDVKKIVINMNEVWRKNDD